MKEIDTLCSYYRDYLDNLPTYENDVRTTAAVAWCLAYESNDYDRLPVFWHKAVGSLLLSLRLLRVGVGYKERDPEVTWFCKVFGKTYGTSIPGTTLPCTLVAAGQAPELTDRHSTIRSGLHGRC